MRIARNQALFREVNERIWETVEEFGSHPAEHGLRLAFVCECGHGECTEQLLLDTEEYGRMRSEPSRRLVRRGHAHDHADTVVEERDGYLVVESGP